MSELGTKEILTTRLLLRKLTVQDSEQMFHHWAANENVTKYLRWHPHRQLDTVIASLQKRETLYQKADYYDWGIEIQATKELIGTITVVNTFPEIKTLEIGYVIGENWWGNGYTLEALQAVSNYLFTATDTIRLEATCDDNNLQSKKVLVKAGFLYEGTLKQRGLNSQGIVDLCMYALLR
ncbi:GNAT family N-acetyltransferase [Enterococcus saccharolyticus]|uniref:GNAT family N-acetyltransferase n=1 Tax=Enterococcus saccharolyticus TaxID=41997 RepID=UPI0039E1ADCA